MRSNFARTIRFNHQILPKWHQKKVPETKVEKIPNGTLKMAFFTWFFFINYQYCFTMQDDAIWSIWQRIEMILPILLRPAAPPILKKNRHDPATANRSLQVPGSAISPHNNPISSDHSCVLIHSYLSQPTCYVVILRNFKGKAGMVRFCTVLRPATLLLKLFFFFGEGSLQPHPFLTYALCTC